MVLEAGGVRSFLHEESVLFHTRDIEIIRLEADTNHQLVVRQVILLTTQCLALHLLLLFVQTHHRALVVGRTLLCRQRPNGLANGALVNSAQRR